MLETARLRLLPFEPAHIDDIVRLYGDPEVMRYMTGRPLTGALALESVERSHRHWDEQGFGMYSLIDRESGNFVGRCGLVRLAATGEVEVGYVFSKECWGKGLATEAAKECVRFGFETLRLPEVIGLTFLQNKPSQIVLEKCGLSFVGTRFHFGRHLLLFSRSAPF